MCIPISEIVVTSKENVEKLKDKAVCWSLCHRFHVFKKKKSTSNLAKKVGGTDDMKLELWNDWIGNLVMINGLHCIHRFQCIMWWCLALATCYSCYKPKPQSGNGVRDFIFFIPIGGFGWVSKSCRREME